MKKFFKKYPNAVAMIVATIILVSIGLILINVFNVQ